MPSSPPLLRLNSAVRVQGEALNLLLPGSDPFDSECPAAPTSSGAPAPGGDDGHNLGLFLHEGSTGASYTVGA